MHGLSSIDVKEAAALGDVEWNLEKTFEPAGSGRSLSMLNMVVADRETANLAEPKDRVEVEKMVQRAICPVFTADESEEEEEVVQKRSSGSRPDRRHKRHAEELRERVRVCFDDGLRQVHRLKQGSREFDRYVRSVRERAKAEEGSTQLGKRRDPRPEGESQEAAHTLREGSRDLDRYVRSARERAATKEGSRQLGERGGPRPEGRPQEALLGSSAFWGMMGSSVDSVQAGPSSAAGSSTAAPRPYAPSQASSSSLISLGSNAEELARPPSP